MAIYLVTCALGPVLLNEEGDVVDWKRWGDSTEKVVDCLLALEEGKVPAPLKELISANRDRIDQIVLEDDDLARSVRAAFPDLEVKVEPGNKVAKGFRLSIAQYLPKLGIGYEDYRKYLHEVSIALTRRKVRKAAEKRDLFIAQAINALDDINKTINLFASRIREWYSLHFPELDDLVDEHEDFLKVVSYIGPRDHITIEKLKELGFKESLARRIVEASKTSMGADVADFDIKAMQQVSDIALKLYEVRRALERYIDEAMLEVAPNIRGLVGPLLGARLISLAGGLSKLATLPASTIQVLGAEKALFRALRTGGKPPKHGVIFQYPAIHRSPRWQRGKIARALAAKLAIAARIDAFTGEYKADELKAELERRIQEIKRLYARPPARRRPGRPGRRRRGGRR